jgi:redox-sensitive bicupin YhaK (pirin superfamily)
MIYIRPADARGQSRLGWLDSRHSFSFGDYQDPRHIGFSNLRVINDDTVAPGGGFASHGHRDMEILSYVLEGALEHRDSMGNGSVIRPGDVQRMSAGNGVRHSEFNHSRTDPVHFLQIWLVPNKVGIEPAYDQRHFPAEGRRGRLRLLVSPDGRDGSIATHQDALLYGALLDGGETVTFAAAAGRNAYVHVAKGKLAVNEQALAAGDGAALNDEREIRLSGIEPADVLLFDLP